MSYEIVQPYFKYVALSTLIFGFTMLRAAEPTYQEFETAALAKERKQQWKGIAWQSDMSAALKAAKKKSKPLFVMLVVGHRGRKKAALC